MSKMGFNENVSVDVKSSGDEGVVCDVEVGDQSNFLIGQHGVNLQALQHVARLLLRKKTQEKLKFILDVNGYRNQKNQSIAQIAHQAAEEAIREKRAVVMKPMSTYERRVVHMELSKNSAVVTESIGEGEGRKVVVKPASSI